MANTGFISVAPQIAALAAQVTAVDAVVDAIRAIDISALAAEHVLIGVDTAAIRAVDVPALAAEHVIIDGEIEDIDTVVDLIRSADVPALTAAIAAKAIRGTLHDVHVHNDTVNYVNAVNISGSGKLLYIIAESIGTSSLSFQGTIDSISYNGLQVATGTIKFLSIEKVHDEGNFAIYDTIEMINFDYSSQLQLQFKTFIAGQDTALRVIYIED